MAKKLKLHHLSRQLLLPDQFKESQAELIDGSDRTCALVAGSIVDMSLTQALNARFALRDQNHFNSIFYEMGAPLGTFSSRISIGRALGIFGDRMETILNRIRKIRNAFAHSAIPLTFDNALVKEECEKLPDVPVHKSFSDKLSKCRQRYVGNSAAMMVLLGESAQKHVLLPKHVENCDQEWVTDTQESGDHRSQAKGG